MMDHNQALDDLKSIRQIMHRTQQEAGKHGGWFILIAGVMWLVGFTANQFLREEYAGWSWAVVNLIGMIAMIGMGIRLTKHSSIRTPLWKPVFFFWMGLGIFAGLLIWLFGVSEIQIGLLALLIAALGYVQIGTIFQSRHIAITGILIAVLAIEAFHLVPDYFSLAAAVLGGGVLIGSGLWMIRTEK